jgi:hypothetical protein
MSSREIEAKMLVENSTFEQIAIDLKQYLSRATDKFTTGSSIDMYWRPADGARASFLRFRVSDEADLTAKVIDKMTIDDREEFVVPVSMSKKDDMLNLLESVLGEGTPILFRWIDLKIGQDTTISLVQNVESTHWTFLEVESSTRESVDYWIKNLSSHFAELKFSPVKNSFYDIFVQKRGVQL